MRIDEGKPRPRMSAHRRPGRIRRYVPFAALVAWGAFIAVSLPRTLHVSWKRVEVARRDWSLGADEALAVFRKPEYVAAIRKIREALPEDAEYVLLSSPDGDDVLVRFDLAPRRPVWGGAPADISVDISSARLSDLPPWTVVPRLAGPGPILVRTRLLAETGRLP
jgi:hypothetical protein